MGWVMDARPSLNVSAFFGGGTHRLWHSSDRAIGSCRRSEQVPPASSQGFQAGLNELLSSLHLKRELLRNLQIFAATVGNTCQFPQSWSFPSLSHEGNSAKAVSRHLSAA